MIDINVGDIINACLLFLTLVGLTFTAYQLIQTKAINRAQLVKELYLQMYSDDYIREIFYRIEWSDYTHIDIFQFRGTETEQMTDRLLSFYETICNMYYRKSLTREDMLIFDYEMMRVFQHPSIREYLSFLEKWQDNVEVGKSYSYYKCYCREYFSQSEKGITRKHRYTSMIIQKTIGRHLKVFCL